LGSRSPGHLKILILGAKAHAAVRGKFSTGFEDVKAVSMGIFKTSVIIKNLIRPKRGISEEDIILKLL